MMITISSAVAIGGLAAVIVMLFCGTANLREISLFPMNQQAVDLLMGAPSEVRKQLRELNIRLNLAEQGLLHLSLTGRGASHQTELEDARTELKALSPQF